MLSTTLLGPPFLVGAAVAALALLGALWWMRPSPARVGPSQLDPAPQTRRDGNLVHGFESPDRTDTDIAFLFRDGQLSDATSHAERLLGTKTHLDGFIDAMRHRFPQVAEIKDAPDGIHDLPSALPQDEAALRFDKRGPHLSATLHDPHANASDRHLWLSARQTSALIQNIVDHVPIVIWSCDPEGRLAHGNAAFYRLAEMSGKAMPFDLPQDNRNALKRRLWIEEPETGARQWFDLSSHDLPDGTRVFFAANADAIVTAEIAQRNFVQTLTKTFAQLSIGLAIFDRHRQLALFNPALIDLTSLPADFLSARPTLATFFDQLRDRQIMPEPRNYRNWRDQLSDMMSAARDGAYCETWTLPTGLTYRISGKPHPDGAVAFLFEDISAEITLTRRFRAELEQSQAVIDAIDSAIAVFSRSGVLTFANQSFRELWKCNPDESFIELTILDVSKIWQESCAPTPVWGDLRDFVRSVEERADWQDVVQHHSRGPLSVLAAPVTGGATLVRFIEQPHVAAVPLPSPSQS